MSIIKFKDLSDAAPEILAEGIEVIAKKLEEENLQAKAQEIIERYDIHGDKSLQRSELIRFLYDVFDSEAFDVEVDDELVSKLIDECDLDGNGKLEKEDVVELSRKILTAMRDEFEKCLKEKE
ncbi:unnamed protein product [Moneuplotes crassus]|uniref:EF-hand domain-containing protein n=1 Tax=Euplotes crassus TaxID=5936 RepID=A0AAD2D5M2_EUPCR|nr:unnamed protein product [Moneuplotes crassus]